MLSRSCLAFCMSKLPLNYAAILHAVKHVSERVTKSHQAKKLRTKQSWQMSALAAMIVGSVALS